MITLALGMVVWGLAFRWVSLTKGDNGIAGVPADSNDGQALYVAVNNTDGTAITGSGYLLKLDSTTLATISKVFLTDPTGRQVETTLPFYNSASLLREGMTYFSAEAGLPRLQYGTQSNDYVAQEKPLEILQIDETVAHRQAERLKKLRAERSSNAVARQLTALRKASQGKENLMPFILDAVKSYATLGEICDAMRDTFGTYEEVAIT